jgi:FHA domain
MTSPQRPGRYVSGPWALLCGARTWLLADVVDQAGRLDTLWALIGGANDLGDILTVLAEDDFGFALLQLDPGAERAIVRGDGVVVVRTGDGEPSVLRGPEALPMWGEYPLASLPHDSRLAIRGSAAPTTWLPISGGVTLAAGAEIGDTSSPASVARPTDFELDRGSQALSEPTPVAEEEEEEEERPPSTQYDFLFEATKLRSVPEIVPRSESQLPDEAEVAPAAEPGADEARTLFGEPPMTNESEPVFDSLIASVPGVATSPEASPQERTTAPIERDPDVSEIDDRTVSRAQLLAAARTARPVVKAIPCPSGHPNPPLSTSCRVCAAALPAATPVTVPRPILGTLRLSTGAAIPLDRGAIFGRNPDADGFGDGERPHIVQVPSPGKDISRNHVEVKLDGWHVLVSDLGSTNGTIVTVPGHAPQRLHPNEAMPIAPGTVVNLADEVSFVYEVGL